MLRDCKHEEQKSPGVTTRTVAQYQALARPWTVDDRAGADNSEIMGSYDQEDIDESSADSKEAAPQYPDSHFIIPGCFGTIADQYDESYLDDRSNASDDMEKGQIQFPQYISPDSSNGYSGKRKKVKLYGRNEELKKLTECFRQVSDGRLRKSASHSFSESRLSLPFWNSKAVFLSGYSGVGKSSLVETFVAETQERHTSSSFYFARGKYSELHKSEPFSAISDAFGALALDILGRTSSLNPTSSCDSSQNTNNRELDRIRDNLHECGLLNSDERHLLMSILPVLSPLFETEDQSLSSVSSGLVSVHSAKNFGLHPDINIIKDSFVKFVRCCCHNSDFVFILYLDSLQWADDASLELITALLLELDSFDGFLFIGSYRSDVVNEVHPWNRKMMEIKDTLCCYSHDSIQQNNCRLLETIDLYNLSPQDVSEFLADILSRSVNDVQPLLDAIYSKTLGNMFYVTLAIEELVCKNAIYYDMVYFQWKWNLAAIELKNYLSHTDVLSMILAKIRELPGIAQRLLVLGAFVRSTICIETMLALLKQCDGVNLTEHQLTSLLDCVVSEGLLLPVLSYTGRFKFAHDRVQEAVHSLVPKGGNRDRMLVRIAGVLRGLWSSTEDDWMLFVAVGHLNSVPSSYVNPEGLAVLNLQVAKLAMVKGAFAQSTELLRSGLRCLKSARWEEYDLSLELSNRLLEMEYMMANYENAEVIINEVLQNSLSANDKFRAYITKINCAVERDNRNYKLGVRMALKVLNDYGMYFPEHPSKSNIYREEVRVKLALRHKSLLSISQLPIMEDESIVELLGAALRFAMMSGNSTLQALIGLRSVRITIAEKQISKYLPFIFTALSLSLRKKKLYENAYSYAQVAMIISERFPAENGESHVMTQIMLYGNILNLRQPFKDSIGVHIESYKQSISCGSSELALAHAMHYPLCYLASSYPLTTFLEPKLVLYEEMSRKFEKRGFLAMFQICRQTIVNLQGKCSHQADFKGPVFDEDIEIEQLEGNSKKMTTRDAGTMRLMLACIFGDEEVMVKMMDRLSDFPVFDLPIVREHLRNCFMGIAGLHLGKKKHDSKLTKLGARAMKHFKELYDSGSQNAFPVYLCLKAISEPSRGSFDTAISACCDVRLLHLEALMNEYCARYLEDEDKPNDILIQMYIKRSYWLYYDWGALAKVNQLKKNYGFLQALSRDGAPSYLGSLIKESNSLGTKHIFRHEENPSQPEIKQRFGILKKLKHERRSLVERSRRNSQIKTFNTRNTSIGPFRWSTSLFPDDERL